MKLKLNDNIKNLLSFVFPNIPDLARASIIGVV